MNPFLLLLVLSLVEAPTTELETMRLVEFRDDSDVDAWRAVHDGVMGGVSVGRASFVDRAARFEGRVSLQNNGGFVSFRLTSPQPDLSGFDGLRLKVRGAGRVYKVSLRTDGTWDGVAWQASFATTEGEWDTIELEFDDLVPRWRGRLVRDAGPFDPVRHTGSGGRAG